MNAKEFFDAYKTDVFRTCYYMAQNVQDAEDLCQEVFVKALQQNFQQIEKPKPWLLSITMNICRNYLKRKKRIVLMDWIWQTAAPERVEDTYEAKERQSELMQILQTLPEKIRSVIILKYLHQLKNEEVAAILQIPEGTVKSRCNKGIQTLRKSMQITYTEWMREGLL